MFKKSLLVLLSFVSFQGLGAWGYSVHTACQGYDPIEVKKAIDAGADVNEMNWSYQSPLMYVCTFAFYEKLALNYAEQLIAAKANVNCKDPQGDTALHIACQNSNHHLVFLLLNNGANPYAKNNSGSTALHVACKRSYIDSVTYLLAFGAHVNARDDQGSTPLHIASKAGNKSLVQLLLKHGADRHAIDKNGYTPADVCCKTLEENVATIKLEILGLLKS